MRVIVCSDSHGQMEALERAVGMFEADLLIHLGDHAADALRLNTHLPVEVVRGNCDFTAAPEEKVLALEGKRILITHGHRYQVKGGTELLAARMKEVGAHAALYGHTHLPGYEFYGRGFVLNPGALCGSRRNGKKTFAYLEWTEKSEIFMQLTEL